jgi:hypothetical protein
MQMNIEKNIGQTACRTFIGGGKGRVLALRLLLVLLIFFASAVGVGASVFADTMGQRKQAFGLEAGY